MTPKSLRFDATDLTNFAKYSIYCSSLGSCSACVGEDLWSPLPLIILSFAVIFTLFLSIKE